ncbi:MAG: azurin [Chitinophagaceae bacterium]|nr:azurin [Chitinophagaceae bacterium]MCW5928584.1 azurin [Chitinophagaceae bacterium]
MKIVKYLMVASIAGLVACGGGEDKKAEQTTTEETKTETTQPASSEGTTLEITGNDVMKFDKTELRAKAGKITLTLIHDGKLAKEAMGHNVVILKPGSDVSAYAAKAVGARDTEYVPASESASVVAHTKLIGGGEKDTIEFTISEPGTYPFLCSFPGHVGFMKGDLIVE